MKIETKFNRGDAVSWKSKFTPYFVINPKTSIVENTGKIESIDALIHKTSHIEYTIFDDNGVFMASVMEEDLYLPLEVEK